MSKTTAAGLLGLLGLVVIAACATATGDVKGGEGLFDASAPVSTIATQTCDIGADAGSGSTFTDLYRDFFGPTGAAKCSGDGACHGDATQAGAKSSGNYVCGADKTECHDRLVSPDTGLVQIPQDQADPSKSGLVSELRRKKPDGTIVGLMPKRPTCVFEQVAIDRVQAWIAAGAPNN